MKSLEQLKSELETLELKARVYSNELCDSGRLNDLELEIAWINSMILTLMVDDQESHVNAAKIA